MAVIGEHDDAAQVAVDHPTFAHVAGQQHELLAVSAPVDWQHRAAGVDRLVLRQDISIPVEQRHDPGILPEVDRDVLQAGKVRPELAHTRTLIVADPDVLENFAVHVEHDESLVAAACVHARRGLGIAAQVANHDAVGMVPESRTLAPETLALVSPDRIADRHLIPAVVAFERVRIMAGLLAALPEQFEPIVVSPEMLIAVLDQQFTPALVAGKIHECDRVAGHQVVGAVLARGRFRHPHPALHLSGGAVEDLKL